jgi:hypothetical protein
VCVYVCVCLCVLRGKGSNTRVVAGLLFLSPPLSLPPSLPPPSPVPFGHACRQIQRLCFCAIHIYTCVCVCTYTYISPYTHTHTHTHTETHKHCRHVRQASNPRFSAIGCYSKPVTPPSMPLTPLPALLPKRLDSEKESMRESERERGSGKQRERKRA